MYAACFPHLRNLWSYLKGTSQLGHTLLKVASDDGVSVCDGFIPLLIGSALLLLLVSTSVESSMKSWSSGVDIFIRFISFDDRMISPSKIMNCSSSSACMKIKKEIMIIELAS